MDLSESELPPKQTHKNSYMALSKFSLNTQPSPAVLRLRSWCLEVLPDIQSSLKDHAHKTA